MDETIFGFQARAKQSFRTRLDAKDVELQRAIRALRLEAAKLAEVRQRMKAVQNAVDMIRNSYRGCGASQAAYVAILAQKRVAKALAGAID